MWERRSSGRRSDPVARRSASNLAERRRRRRRRLLVASLILLFVLVAAVVYGLRQPAVRIAHVTIAGGDPELADLATAAIRGSYLGIIPRDSIFFYPAGDIRTSILSAHPEIAAVSISRSGFSSLSIEVDARVPVARWCGPTYYAQAASSTPAADCYLFDASGFVYATATDAAALVPPKLPSEGGPINTFAVYEYLTGSSTAPLGAAVGATLPSAAQLPAAFDFARKLASLGSPVVSVGIRDDEVDDYLASGTRVTYLLGGEQGAYAALVSAKADLNLADGSIEYVDLRFPGKVYLKKKG